MELLEGIKARRAIREFKGERVSDALVRKLLDAAVRAPSAMNRQPWAFVVVQDRKLLDEISHEATRILMKQPGLSKLIEEARKAPGHTEYDIFHGAHTLIVVCAKPQGLHPDWDCCLAGQNLMLAATSLGLGTCVIGLAWEALNESKTMASLGIPRDFKVVLPIVVGVPAAVPEPTPRREPEVLSWRAPVHR